MFDQHPRKFDYASHPAGSSKELNGKLTKYVYQKHYPNLIERINSEESLHTSWGKPTYQ